MGNADVLCIGEDGHIEIETNCLPCCNNIETSCEINVEEDLHDEHVGCNNCSDLILGSSFWSKRYSNLIGNSTSAKPVVLLDVNTDTTYSLTIESSQIHRTFFTFNKSPNYAFILSTILRC